MRLNPSIYLLLCLPLWISCASLRSGKDTSMGVAERYEMAIADACYVEEGEISQNLWPINADNQRLVWKEIKGEPHVLMVSWKQNISYYKPYLDSAYYPTGAYEIWVTPAPQLQQRMASLSYTNADDRLKRLLGLPPTATYSYFVEFWVKPADLFRPCPDPEIEDTQCERCFPAGVSKAHQDWINASRISRYYPCKLYDQYPWSQLGYTYDWSADNPSHIGLSEYVIKTNSKVVLKDIKPTAEYLDRK